MVMDSMVHPEILSSLQQFMDTKLELISGLPPGVPDF